jgi:type VI secretion system secreted protein VgrG
MPEVGGGRFKFEIDGLASHTWVARVQGDEAISQLFQFDLDLTSDERDIPFSDVVGHPALLTLETEKQAPRYVHGIVSRFEQGEEGKRLSAYHATLVPRAWRLLHRHDARIFQELKVPEIIEKVLTTAGLSGTDYRLAVLGQHPVREYCVQYRESDWAFISRLMEEEGIFCFFEHHPDKHVLVMADDPGVYKPIDAPATLVFRPPLGALAHSESVARFWYAEEVRPGKVTLTDFNFKKPNLSLLASSQAPDDPDLEVYDYPGEYDAPGDGASLTKVRLEEWQSIRKAGEGESGCMRFTPGYLFTLSEHGRDEYNRRYLITRVHHSGAQPQMGEAGSTEDSYLQRFQVIPDDVPFRPARRTQRPTVKGVQTAIVVGPGGEEIHTDEHGRVKVQFHWDRQGKHDEKSSCWIRVSQLWAGPGWGAMYIPRIGQEVIVDFIEGDPDRPIVVGRVYHGTNVPPYPLPAEKTKSTIKSNSSPGGGGSNEFRFEDKKGQEEIYLHGQKDWTIKIEHDKNQRVGHDETLEVGNDRTKTVKHDETLEVDHDRTKTVKHDETETVSHDQTETIGHDHTTTIANDRTETIGHDHTSTIANNRTETIGQDHTSEIANDRNVTIGNNEMEIVGTSATRMVGVNQDVTVGVNATFTVGAVATLSVGAAIALELGGGLSLMLGEGSSETVPKGKTSSVGEGSTTTIGQDASVTVGGGSSMTIGKDASVTVGGGSKEEVKGEKTTIVGQKLSVQCGGATVTVEMDGTITVQGTKLIVQAHGPIQVNGTTIDVKSEGALNLEAAGRVMIKDSNGVWSPS